jgi:preprotein translocase subunit SecG
MFGSSGAGNFLTKLTTGIAVLFMVTSLTLATISNKSKSSSVIQSVEEALPGATTKPKDSSGNSSN